MRTPLVALALAGAISGAAPLPAQESTSPTPEVRTNIGLVFVGATVGSMAGMTAWLVSGGIYSEDPSLGTVALVTTLASAFGGWVGSGARNTTDLRRFVLGAAVGVAGGFALGTIARGGSNDHIGSVAVQYSIGQGIVTTWLGTRRPRRPR